MTEKRNKRSLRTIRILRARTARQEDKIEILCKDMVAAHTEFIEQLSIMQFTVLFQDALLAATDKTTLLNLAANQLCARLGQIHTAVFAAATAAYKIHLCDDSQISREHLKAWFPQTLAEELALSHKICSLQEMLQMGMQAGPAVLRDLTAAAVPMAGQGQPVGFVLIWRNAEQTFTKAELARAAAATNAVARAISQFKQKAPLRHQDANTAAR